METVCRARFDPLTREHPPAVNSEAAEQLWAATTDQVSSVMYMGRARFRFVLLSAFALWNSWSAKTPYAERETRKLKLKRAGANKHTDRHQELKARAAAAEDEPGKDPQPKAGREKKATRRGRMPEVESMKEFPLGFDERLMELRTDMARRKYATCDPRWFRDNEAFLLAEVRKILPPFGEPTHNAKWKCISMLHRTLVDWCVEGRPVIPPSFVPMDES